MIAKPQVHYYIEYCVLLFSAKVVLVSRETSTTLAETQSSVSSVRVQSKGFFIVFLVIQMSLFLAYSD